MAEGDFHKSLKTLLGCFSRKSNDGLSDDEDDKDADDNDEGDDVRRGETPDFSQGVRRVKSLICNLIT